MSKPENDFDRLQRRHKKLKERVSEYESRLSLSPAEQADLSKLKKEKLRTKDALSSLGS